MNNREKLDRDQIRGEMETRRAEMREEMETRRTEMREEVESIRMNHVKPIYSLKTKIALIVILGIAIASSFCIWTIIPKMKSSMETTVENYIKDIALLEGESLDRQVETLGTEEALSADALAAELADISISGMPSSYAYLFSADGTMLYHPTADKIGKPVENVAANQLLAEIAAGNRPETDVIAYEFNGSQKYAGYYIGQDMSYVVIITADGDEVFAEINSTTRSSVISAIVILVFFAGVAMFFTALLFKPIRRITDIVNTIADMDFRETDEQKKVLNRHDEIGMMAKSIEELRRELVQIADQIKDKSGDLYDASESMSTGTEQTLIAVEQVETAITEIAKGATSQAQETQTASEQVIEMGEMIEETGTEVENLRTNARAMRDAGNQADAILKELSEINQKTREAMMIIDKQTADTNESAERIREAAEIITDIAEETNLLSLNASIEAARAGEQGRGFAVVASQIQKLAEQSNDSARQIESIITMLIAESQKSVETMKEVREIVETQDQNVSKTQEAFASVQSGIALSVEGIRAIASRTQRLDEARERVVDVVQSLTAIAEENAASTEETSASAEEVNAIIGNIAENAKTLSEIAQELERSANRFITD